jgi:serine/threonine protein kinase
MNGVADGLSYLHSNDVIHGDLKGVSCIHDRGLIPLIFVHQLNILFDNGGVPLIADFGSASITFNPQTNNASTPSNGLSIRWTAPEIFESTNDNSRRPTKMSDVYAFAMVVIEVKYHHRS